MAATLGTYSAGVSVYTPWNIIPEPGDVISLDWMEACSQFSQRYLKQATVVGVILADGGSYGFSYSSLGCDLIPPILQAYEWNNTLSCWRPHLEINGGYVRFGSIGTTFATFVNKTGAVGTFQLIAYL